jgi:VWFA-related protein
MAAAGICAVTGAVPGGRVGGQQPAPPEPTFRTDANFVLTDVFVTADGTPVADLTQADFELREDGVVQAIRSFEAVRPAPQPVGLARRAPSTVAESSAAIGDPRRRVFVVYLDTFHVDQGDSIVVRKPLLDFLRTALGPDDLVAYMNPPMSGRDLSFSNSVEPLIRYFDDNPVWGVADGAAGAATDDIERDLQACFVGDETTWLPIRSRLRELKTIESLRSLVAHLDGLRESRKAIITVTMGWRLFRDNQTRLPGAGHSNRIRGLDPIAVGPGGGLGTEDGNRIGGAPVGTCDAARLHAAMNDTQQAFLDLIGEANRSSTSFYTLDAAGLRTETRPHPLTERESFAEARNRERAPFSTRLDSIRTLGEATNGRAIIDSNDVGAGLRRAAADFNAYYLLGYTSSNDKADGGYRKIKVTVKRPGVQVRAREGYRARRPDDRPPATPTSASPGAAAVDAQLTAALGRLTPARPGVPLVVSAAAGTVAGGAARTIRVTAELDPVIAATTEWAEGGEAQALVRDVRGNTVTGGKAVLPKGARTVEIEVPVVDGMTGDVAVQVRLAGTGPLARYTDTTSVALDAAPTGWGPPRLSRRGPSTGIAWVPTADPRFRRQERLRVTVGVGVDAGSIAGTLLDRHGKTITVPVRIERPEPAALIAELALAPLAAGDYVLALGANAGPRRLLVPLRVVP